MYFSSIVASIPRFSFIAMQYKNQVGDCLNLLEVFNYSQLNILSATFSVKTMLLLCGDSVHMCQMNP